jgi:hypothetical protein
MRAWFWRQVKSSSFLKLMEHPFFKIDKKESAGKFPVVYKGLRK